jgi:hypothetical protein
MTLGGVCGYGFDILTEPGSRPVVTIGGVDAQDDAHAAAAKVRSAIEKATWVVPRRSDEQPRQSSARRRPWRLVSVFRQGGSAKWYSKAVD